MNNLTVISFLNIHLLLGNVVSASIFLFDVGSNTHKKAELITKTGILISCSAISKITLSRSVAELATASVSSCFLAPLSTCEHENSCNCFIHGTRESVSRVHVKKAPSKR